MAKSGSHKRKNKEVRELLYGGAQTLDAIELFHQIQERHAPHSEAGQIARLALDKLQEIADAMRDGVVELRRPDSQDPT